MMKSFLMVGQMPLSFDKKDAMPGILVSKVAGKIMISSKIPFKYLPMAQMRKYRQEHKAEIYEKKKQYMEANKEHLQAKKKAWAEANKERLKANRKINDAKKKAKLLEEKASITLI